MRSADRCGRDSERLGDSLRFGRQFWRLEGAATGLFASRLRSYGCRAQVGPSGLMRCNCRRLHVSRRGRHCFGGINCGLADPQWL